MRPRNKTIAPLTLEDLSPFDREAVEGFQFFLSVMGKPQRGKSPEEMEQIAPQRQLGLDWYHGLLTVDEGKRLRGGM